MGTIMATKFVAWEVPTLEALKGSKGCILREKLNNGGQMNREEKDWLTRNVNNNTYFKSAVSLQGWRFDFSDVLRTFIVCQYGHWTEYKSTDSNHHYHKYDNLIKDVVPLRPNEIWVSDITYVETKEGVCYLSLITNAYSRKIVGWDLGPTLEATYPINALKIALSTIDDATVATLIHHSDRGCQYCSNAYVQELKNRFISISMTQSGPQKRCWKNPWEADVQ